MAYLILIRHGISEWNKLGLWTGWRDPELAPEGFEEARNAARCLLGTDLDIMFTADLKRTIQTADTIKKELNSNSLEIIISPALRERNYGDLAGKNKWDVKKEYGEIQFAKWRRGWDEPIPNGESLKDVYGRAVPFYQKEIEPKLSVGNNVLIVASGNSLRALVKYLENISDSDISQLEIGTGEVIKYNLSKALKIIDKKILAVNSNKGKI